MANTTTISYVLRIGIAFAFLYPPIAAFLDPAGWIWFVPSFIEVLLPRELFLQLFGVFEILVALGVLFMKNPTTPAVFAALTLCAIIILDWSAFDIVFRDIPILLSAIALILFERERRRGIPV